MSTESAPLYAAKTVYDEAAYRALVWLMLRKLRPWPRYLVMATGLFSMVGAGYVMISTGDISIMSLLFLFLGNLFLMFGIFAQRLMVRMMMASNKKGEVPENHYAFYPDHVMITTGEGKRGYAYTAMRRVLDSQGFLFFFFRDGQAFVMRHNDMPAKQFISLRDFLNARLAERQGA